MNAPEPDPTLHSDALAREIAQDLRDEGGALIAAAEREAAMILSGARTDARRRVHDAIAELRREGALRHARAKAQAETGTRVRAQRRAAQAVAEAVPLLRQALAARWHDPQSRRQWTNAAANLCTARLRPGTWRVTHPAAWSETEQQEFAAAVGRDVAFAPDATLTAGIRIDADQATLDATPHGLLADERAIAALLLSEIDAGAGS